MEEQNEPRNFLLQGDTSNDRATINILNLHFVEKSKTSRRK